MNQIQLDYKTMLKDHKIEIDRLEKRVKELEGALELLADKGSAYWTSEEVMMIAQAA
jgi:archaellum component FlaC